jgi:hypothetical protein
MGRTLSKDEIVNAVLLWIRGASLQELYGKFQFVDREKRALESLSAAMISAQPILASSVEFDLRPIGSDLFELLCLAQDRDCKFSFWGKNEIPLATFHWDECPMFSIPARDGQEMAHLLKSWLCDLANPSAIKSENPKIDLRSVAAYYEQGNRIEPGQVFRRSNFVMTIFETMDDAGTIAVNDVALPMNAGAVE